jgi:CBS domain-containing protein
VTHPHLDMAAADVASRPLADVADGIRVSAVMSRALVTVTPEQSVASAYEVLTAARVHHLPVVDDRGRPLALLDGQTLAETWPVSAADDRQRTIASLLPPRRPDCVLAEASLRVAAVDMHLGATDAVCVVDVDGCLVGLVTARDIVAAVAGRSPATA